MIYSSNASKPPEISTEMTCDQNSEVPTFHTYVSLGNTENRYVLPTLKWRIYQTMLNIPCSIEVINVNLFQFMP